MSDEMSLAVIGGSGLYALDGLETVAEHDIDTPWGKPSDPILEGRLSGVRMLFLPRHGAGHRIPPSDLNFQANIAALKMLGATDVLSISACGSFREELAPGTFVVVDQFIDRTRGRASSFFGPGLVAHVSMAHPVCPGLSQRVFDACEASDIAVHMGGTYLAMEGPQFSTLAESKLYRSWGCDVIGMTNMPEAKLAREAELPYAALAMVTDYDCWHEEVAAVEVSNVLEVLRGNADKARTMLQKLAPTIGPKRTPSPAGIETVLDFALITAPDHRDPVLMKKLAPIISRVTS
ncbi:S-methyl-5'-thioadenosine phosphorylase [Parvularcula sp. LCG005]|uniref:S-methyl-5'-thioadenosine phosphorylase n=1 Tax=Parvularcula sp. LCG005 TaxID=3078805 RepID=UPI00294234FE|nr:S-methyl-5'-thioadenosine phosphorylase [Parvularcula sp. LCG005]WOI52514.1 S-methyl-5'-thioadenosine phosphorylase [Parvularcula sp. LCG005]